MHAVCPEAWELERFQTASDLQGHSRSMVLVWPDRILPL